MLGEETSRNHQAYKERPPRHHNIIRNKGFEEVNEEVKLRRYNSKKNSVQYDTSKDTI